MRNLINKLLAGLAVIVRRPLLLIGLTVVIVAALMATRPRLAPVQLPERVWPVDVVEVWLQDEQPMLNLFGQVAAGRRTALAG